ncbi:hypothetical protein PtB15_6B624 [Puccinia triticina]|nr:hypothetical protein PtB15_6B624 [Puccinia triticina]
MPAMPILISLYECSVQPTPNSPTKASPDLDPEQRDKNLIYHEALPSEANLPPIEKSSVGDSIAIQEVYGAPEVQKVEKANLIQTKGQRCETDDTELVTALEYAGLPTSYEKFSDFVSNGLARLCEMTKPPNQALELAEEVQQGKEVMPIKKMREESTGLRNKVLQDLDSIQQKLNTDAHNCEQMRSS